LSKFQFLSIVAWTFLFSFTVHAAADLTPTQLIAQAQKQKAAGNYEAAMSSLVAATTHTDATNADRKVIAGLAGSPI